MKNFLLLAPENMQTQRKDKLKIKTFEIQNEPFQFEKIPVDSIKLDTISQLTQQLKSEGDAPPRIGGDQLASSADPDIKLILKIFLPNGKAIKLKVWGRSTVEFVIEQSLRQMLDMESADINKPPVPTLSDPKGYLLRFAEDDGTPDDDLPGKNISLL